MTIERPMFPPRAESVDSFSPQPAIGQPESQTLTSDSPKPAEGLSRRNMLSTLAVLPAALPVLPVAAAPNPPQGFHAVIGPDGRVWFEADEADPAFALIAEKRAADIAHGNAIDAQDEADGRYGDDSEQAWDAAEACEEACDRAMDVAWQLARTAPTTLAGVAAILRFANQHEDEGFEWANTDAIGREGWHYQLRATMAQAIETIIRRGVA
jgi:hypothetical protein